VNHAGRPVTLLEGPAYAVGAVTGALAGGAGAPAAIAGLGAGALGALDDLVGDSSSKGLRGHLAAALRGEMTTGVIKIVGLGATGLLSAWMVDRSREGTRPPGAGPMGTLVGGAVIAGSANIANLLDLRPGRALKVVLLLAVRIITSGRGPGFATAGAGATAGAAAGAAMAAMPAMPARPQVSRRVRSARCGAKVTTRASDAAAASSSALLKGEMDKPSPN